MPIYIVCDKPCNETGYVLLRSFYAHKTYKVDVHGFLFDRKFLSNKKFMRTLKQWKMSQVRRFSGARMCFAHSSFVIENCDDIVAVGIRLGRQIRKERKEKNDH